MFIATLVADHLAEDDVERASAIVSTTSGRPAAVKWIERGRACDLVFTDRPQAARTALEGGLQDVDVIVQAMARRRRRLLIADMDSTMITVECIDELADYAGRKAEVSQVTERAMRGEIDFAEALRDRVALLAGLPVTVIDQCLHERVRPTDGGSRLISDFRAAGGRAVLVSGGFTHFAEPVATALGFDRVIANVLCVREGRLSGETEQPIVDAATKREILLSELSALDFIPEDSVAIGDGANDIPMIEAAGLGIAYHAKPRTAAAADACVQHGNLDVVRYALGLH